MTSRSREPIACFSFTFRGVRSLLSSLGHEQLAEPYVLRKADKPPPYRANYARVHVATCVVHAQVASRRRSRSCRRVTIEGRIRDRLRLLHYAKTISRCDSNRTEATQLWRLQMADQLRGFSRQKFRLSLTRRKKYRSYCRRAANRDLLKMSLLLQLQLLLLLLFRSG